eukprot:scaffold1954_cov268-Pinguiococcus_pyrenoidosus.AAC.75
MSDGGHAGSFEGAFRGRPSTRAQRNAEAARSASPCRVLHSRHVDHVLPLDGLEASLIGPDVEEGDEPQDPNDESR